VSEVLSFHRPPSPLLAPVVASLSYIEGVFPHGRERVVPSGTSQLLFNLDADRLETFADNGVDCTESTAGAALSGVRSSHTVIDSGGRCALIIVGFRPGGAYPFFDAPSSATSGRLVGLDALWGGRGTLLRDRLLEAPSPEARLDLVEEGLRAHLVRPPVRDPFLTFAVAALDRGAHVSAVSERLGLTSKGFVRSFREQTGLTPKRFARIRRFQRTLSSIQCSSSTDWSELAARCGYFDQAHLIHEFREFAGITPTQYLPRAAGGHNHVAL